MKRLCPACFTELAERTQYKSERHKQEPLRDCGRGDKHGETYGDQSETVTGLFILRKTGKEKE